jgi:hypothetical protein
MAGGYNLSLKKKIKLLSPLPLPPGITAIFPVDFSALILNRIKLPVFS